MFLRPNYRAKDGKEHSYWSLVETVRTVDGPRQKTLCYLGELNGSAQARWVKTIEVFNEQGESEQLKLFHSEVEPPADDPQVARILVNRVRLERTRQFGGGFPGSELWKRLGLDSFFERLMDEEATEVPWSRVAAVWPSIGCVHRGASWPSRSAGTPRRRWTICWKSRKARSMIRVYIAVWTACCRTRRSSVLRPKTCRSTSRVR